MFCEKCGNQMNDTDKFCMFCGWQTGASVSAEDSAASQQAEGTAAAEDSAAVQQAEGTAAAEDSAASQQAEGTAAAEDSAASQQAEGTAAAEDSAASQQAEGTAAAEDSAASQQAEGTAAAEDSAASQQAERTAAAEDNAASQQWEATSTAQNVSGQAQNVFNSAVGGAAGTFAAVKDTAGKASGKVNKKVLIGLGCVLVAVLLVVCNMSALAHFYYKNFTSPETYYKYVEKKAAEETVGSFMNYYDTCLDSMDWTNRKMDAEFTVELSEDLRDMIAFTGVDVDWLESAGLGMGLNINNQDMQVDVSASLNKEKLISMDIIVDSDEEMLYVQIPELSETYIGGDFDSADFEYDFSSFEILAQMADSMPSSKKLEKILNRYIGIALDQVDDVEKDKDTLEVEDISKSYTQLKVTYDSDTAREMLEAVLDEMQDDKDLEKIIVEFGDKNEDLMGMDGDDLYEMFAEGIDYMKDDLDYLIYGDAELVNTVWVDGKGVIRGRTIEFDGVEISSLMPKSGSKFGYEFSVEAAGTNVALVGSGKESGNKLSGDFTLEVNSAPIVDLQVKNYNTKKITEGCLNGTFTISLSDAAGALLGMAGMASDMDVVSMLSDYSIRIDSKVDKNGGTCTYTILDGDAEFASLIVDANYGKGSKISAPSSKKTAMVDDEAALMKWVAGMDYEGIMKSLDKIGIPSDFMDMLEEAIMENMYYMY